MRILLVVMFCKLSSIAELISSPLFCSTESEGEGEGESEIWVEVIPCKVSHTVANCELNKHDILSK